jgi:hypothetical protein
MLLLLQLMLTVFEGRAPLDWGSAKLAFETNQVIQTPRSLLHLNAIRLVNRCFKILKVRNVAPVPVQNLWYAMVEYVVNVLGTAVLVSFNFQNLGK